MTTQIQTQADTPHPEVHKSFPNSEIQDFSSESLERQNLERFKELLVLDWWESHARR